MAFLDLPAELQMEIFSYLEHRPDLKNARCVNRKFWENTSPALFRSVLACSRYKALSVVQKVSLHPIYKAYVKELIFDGSVYNSALAGKYERYQAQADISGMNEGFRWDKMTRFAHFSFPLAQDHAKSYIGTGAIVNCTSSKKKCGLEKFFFTK